MLERKERKNVGQIECEYSDLKTGKMSGRMSKKMSDCRRKFRSQISDNIWTDEKQSRVEAERREKIRREKSRRERVRRKKMQIREKVGTSRDTVFFQ
jgi:hypothetical protein